MFNLLDLPFRAKPVERYVIAIGATLIAFILRLALDPGLGDDFPFLMFYCAIAITAWYGGLGPSLTAIILGGVLAN